MAARQEITRTTGLKVNSGKYDLEERTLRFSKNCIDICKRTGKNTINISLIDQLIRSATSVGANYREATQSLTEKDFYYRINVCRKEAKEAHYWLELLAHDHLDDELMKSLSNEADQLVRIFSCIVIRHRL